MAKLLTESRTARGSACLSDLAFDTWRAGELGPAESSAADAHLARCARCRERRQELDTAAEAFLRSYPVLRPQSERGLAAPRRVPHRSRPQTLAALAGVALAAGVLLFLGLRPPVRSGNEDGTRLKGAERIGFVVRRGEQVFEGVDGQRVRPGDQLRFVATTQAARYLAILSRDGAGVASVYYPTAATHARRIDPAESGLLDSAVELDATLGAERVYGVFCESPFELEPLRAELERAKRLVAPPACRVDELQLVKENLP